MIPFVRQRTCDYAPDVFYCGQNANSDGVHDIIADHAAMKANKEVNREAAESRSRNPSATAP
jgi:hypothetical protein